MNINYKFEKNSKVFLLDKCKSFLLKILSKKSMKLFFLGGDIISWMPISCGYHEEHLVNLISKIASDGHNNFLIDIGSNIGLISAQVGNNFDFIYMYEPNTLCFDISKVNIRISNIDHKSYIFNYGLGLQNETLNLNIPLHNWGGAFLTEGNSYDITTAVQKDGFKSFDPSNYLITKVEIRKAEEVLDSVFKSLQKSNRICGVIKIDVEGYEPSIIRSISKIIPDNLSCIILFESWDEKLDFAGLVDTFGSRASGYLYQKNIGKFFMSSKVFKLFYMLFKKNFNYEIHKFHKGCIPIGDLIIKVDS
jgi:FkbM family methyltransferase